MTSISKESWRELELRISRGDVIPDWFLRFLTPDSAMRLVRVAEMSQNRKFPEQLRAYLHSLQPKKIIAVAPKNKNGKKTKRRHKHLDFFGKPTSRLRKDLTMVPLPRATRAPSRSTWQDIFCYIGGTGSLPVQNDKSANLPNEV